MSREITIEISEEDWREMQQGWEMWNDESYPIHAGYYFKEALIKAGYAEEEYLK